MKINKGIGGSVHSSTQEAIDLVQQEERADICPTCEVGTVNVPDYKSVKDDAYMFWRKLKGVLAMKPKGVEFMLMNNNLLVISEPEEEGILDANDVRLHFGEDGAIKYITSSVDFQFDEMDENVADVSPEDLAKIVTDSKGE